MKRGQKPWRRDVNHFFGVVIGSCGSSKRAFSCSPEKGVVCLQQPTSWPFKSQAKTSPGVTSTERVWTQLTNPSNLEYSKTECNFRSLWAHSVLIETTVSDSSSCSWKSWEETPKSGLHSIGASQMWYSPPLSKYLLQWVNNHLLVPHPPLSHRENARSWIRVPTYWLNGWFITYGRNCILLMERWVQRHWKTTYRWKCLVQSRFITSWCNNLKLQLVQLIWQNRRRWNDLMNRTTGFECAY